MVRPAPAAISVAVALLLVACSGDDPETPAGGAATRTPESSTPASTPAARGLDRFYDQELDWGECRGSFECAQLSVPLDYEDPDGATLSVELVRLPAGDDDPRGSLVVNPGGPGGSGIDYARAADVIVSGGVRERYDILGFDPRGVARSQPVSCLADEELDDFLAIDGSPDDATEERELQAESVELGEGCAERSGDVAEHMGTRDVARDLDVLRSALGDRRLTYLGKSYGTYLGVTYAELFPRRVGRLVLDGQVDPAISSAEVAAGQAAGFQRAFRAFLADCLGRSSCPLSGSVDAAQAQVSGLLDDIDAEPLEGEPDRPVTQGLAVIGIAAALYDEGTWPVLRRALSEALQGQGPTLLALADFYSDRGPDGEFETNGIEALYAVNCLDRPDVEGLDAYRHAAEAIEPASPVFGPFIAWGNLPCASWPYPPQGEPQPVAARGAAPILVVGTTRDPATPYVWARSTAAALSSGRLLTFVGDGHTAYRRGNACIDNAVDRYLLEGQVPDKGTRCR